MDTVEVPVLEILVFGGFEVLVGGQPILDPRLRQRRVKTLTGILAINQGRVLHCDYVASSIWPNSPYEKRRKSFYNAWYKLTKAVCSEAPETSYFKREHYTCQLADAHVRTDAGRVLEACERLMDPSLDAERAVVAYQQLQSAYRGDLLPSEDENPIILRAREEWRGYVTDALHIAALSLQRQREYRTAMLLVQAASRLDPYREDLLRMRMRMLIDMGRTAAALQAYNEAKALFEATVGVPLSPQTDALYTEIVGFKPVHLEIPVASARKRRRKRAPARS